jgi:beta-lactamase regulating signal transducer with metallopeptidase domain
VGPLPIYPQPFLQWLLHASWQASVLICLVLLIQKVVGPRIGVRGRYWLWVVVLIRMAMFWTPPSPVSMHNLLPQPQLARFGWDATAQSGNVGSALAATDGTSATGRRGKAGPAANGTRETGAAASLQAWASHWVNAQITILLLWLAGACTLTGHIIVGYIRLWRIVRREPPVINRWIHRLLRDCQKQMGIKRPVSVIATDSVSSPALFGCLRPRLLMPRAVMAELSVQELRHIFLHELAHLRRDDIVIGYLVTLLHVLHWFNPLIALAFKRMRADREMVCDGLALSVLPPEETIAYGRTVVHQLEQVLTSRPNWVLAALSGDRARIKQRIAMISEFRKQTFRRSPLAFALIGLLACTGLTDAITEGYDPTKDFPTTHRDKHANIVRITICHRDTGKYLVVRGDEVACDANAPGYKGLWEARFDDDFATRDQIVYFYSVATRKYLTSDKQGNLAVNGLEPDEMARWTLQVGTDGARISPYPFAHFYLRPAGQGQAKVEYGTCPSLGWDIDQLWRVKTSDNPISNSEWRRHHVPGPD